MTKNPKSTIPEMGPLRAPDALAAVQFLPKGKQQQGTSPDRQVPPGAKPAEGRQRQLA
ncbi:MAG TPA: hypothetical protein VHP58_03220 [Alphaproteobacteria bacterium]|nr:hypothetical protein [Alphaproteobacteria bacterium]